MGYLADCVSRQHLDETGAPYAGGKLYCYVNGSSTKKNMYTDRDLTESAKHSNPLTLDSRGACKVFWDGTAVRFELWYDDQLVDSWTNITADSGSANGISVITSQDGSLTVSTTSRDGVKVADLKIANNTFEYGTFHGTKFNALTFDSGNMTADTDGIVTAENTLYHVMADVEFTVTSLSDTMPSLWLYIDGNKKNKLELSVDASVGDKQRFTSVFDHFTSTSSGHMALALRNDAGEDPESASATGLKINVSRIDVQLHRVVSTVTNPVSYTDFNKLYYGTGLTTSTLEAAQTNSYKIAAVKVGSDPVTLASTDFQRADTVVTESEYEEMEEEGTLVEGMRYVIIEDEET